MPPLRGPGRPARGRAGARHYSAGVVPAALEASPVPPGPRWARRAELVAGLGCGLASIVILCFVGRELWFRVDTWDFLLRREAGSLDSWLLSHGGHLQMPAVGLHRFLYGVVGLDFWPWYHLPHLVAYAAVMFYMWRIFLRRGADRRVAFAAYLVLLFLGVSYFLSSVAIGSLIVLALLLAVAQMVEREGNPSWRQELLMSGALIAMVGSSSSGVAGLAACALVMLAFRGARRWWPSLVPAAVLYGGWFFTYGLGAEGGAFDPGQLAGAPARALRLLGSTVAGFVGWGPNDLVMGAVALVGLGLGLAWLIRHHRLGRFDGVLLLTAALLTLIVVAMRVEETAADVADRYEYLLVVFLMPVLVPRLRFREGWPRAVQWAVLLTVGGCLLGYNAWLRVDASYRILEPRSAVLRDSVERVGAVVASGQPTIGYLRLRDDLHLPADRALTVGEVSRLVADGWTPPAVPASDVESLRTALRIYPIAGPPDPTAGFPLAREGWEEGGCLLLPAGSSLSARVMSPGEITLAAVGSERRGGLLIVWQDGFGEFPVRLVFDEGSTSPDRAVWADGSRSRFGGEQVLALAPPIGETYLTLENARRAPVFLCGAAGE